MRKAGNVSIKQLNASTNNETGETVITGPSIVNDVGDVESVITSLINNDTILDANDVNGLIDVKLQDYTDTTDLNENYTTKTLLTNTLDNYTSKELLSQSLSEKANYTVTDALNTTATNHENRIKGLEDNFVSTTTLVEILTPQQQQVNSALAGKANLSHTHLISDLNYDASNSLKSIIDGKASSSHTHIEMEEDISELTEQVLGIESALSSHTHTSDEINMPYLL